MSIENSGSRSRPSGPSGDLGEFLSQEIPSADSILDRRGFFSWAKSGLGGAALASLLFQNQRAAGEPVRGEDRKSVV
jgi:hypothetical protein